MKHLKSGRPVILFLVHHIYMHGYFVNITVNVTCTHQLHKIYIPVKSKSITYVSLVNIRNIQTHSAIIHPKAVYITWNHPQTAYVYPKCETPPASSH